MVTTLPSGWVMRAGSGQAGTPHALSPAKAVMAVKMSFFIIGLALDNGFLANLAGLAGLAELKHALYRAQGFGGKLRVHFHARLKVA